MMPPWYASSRSGDVPVGRGLLERAWRTEQVAGDDLVVVVAGERIPLLPSTTEALVA